jgi:hypothetical protein
MVVWYELPLLFLLARPLVWPAGRAWVTPVAGWLLDTSPAGLIATVVGLVPRGDPIAVALRMIAYQVAIGLGLAAWAIIRLRPVCRSLADAQSGALVGLRRRAPRRRRRPPCGEDPMLWKERYATRGPDLLITVLFLGGFGLASLYFAWYALWELIAHGYGASAGDSAPASAFEWAFIVGRGISLTTGHAREVCKQNRHQRRASFDSARRSDRPTHPGSIYRARCFTIRLSPSGRERLRPRRGLASDRCARTATR